MGEASMRLGAPLELWTGLVREGEARVHVALSEPVESYLVFLLQRHLRDGVLGGRILALEWLEALERAGTERADALRDVGDRCLLVAGLFPRLAQRRNVTPAYYAGLGRSAYAELAHAARAGYAELFEQLARAFDAMLQVLAGLRPRPATSPPLRVARSVAVGTRVH